MQIWEFIFVLDFVAHTCEVCVGCGVVIRLCGLIVFLLSTFSVEMLCCLPLGYLVGGLASLCFSSAPRKRSREKRKEFPFKKPVPAEVSSQ